MKACERPAWWSAAAHADRRPFLLARARIAAAIRRWFDAQGFLEIEPSILQTSPGNEIHLSAFRTELEGQSGDRRTLYLHSSPEFASKKLLAAGEEKIFSLTRVFRNRDSGPLHAPEFTMLEWYRKDAPLGALEKDCADLLRLAAEAAGATKIAWRGAEADPRLPPERLSVAAAFEAFAGIDLLATIGAGGAADRDALAIAASGKLGLPAKPDDDWSDLFSKIMSQAIEPRLGRGRATLIVDYPAREAALARINPADRRLAERFEFYCCGVELANAFSELTDPAEQRQRLLEQMAARARIYGESYPIDEDFIAALAEMPEASGAALGFDRLVMLVCGAQHIRQVAWTPLDETDGH